MSSRGPSQSIVPVREQITEYAYSCLPEDHPDGHHFTVKVEYRGEGQWAVSRFRDCLGSNGEWDYEPIPSERSDDWLATHRFDLADAQRLARDVAPTLEVNGWTVQRVLARDKR